MDRDREVGGTKERGDSKGKSVWRKKSRSSHGSIKDRIGKETKSGHDRLSRRIPLPL